VNFHLNCTRTLLVRLHIIYRQQRLCKRKIFPSPPNRRRLQWVFFNYLLIINSIYTDGMLHKYCIKKYYSRYVILYIIKYTNNLILFNTWCIIMFCTYAKYCLRLLSDISKNVFLHSLSGISTYLRCNHRILINNKYDTDTCEWRNMT